MSNLNSYHDLLLTKRWDPWIIFIEHDDEKDDDEVQIKNLEREFCSRTFWAKYLKDKLPSIIYHLGGMTSGSISDEESSLLFRILKILIMAYGLDVPEPHSCGVCD